MKNKINSVSIKHSILNKKEKPHTIAYSSLDTRQLHRNCTVIVISKFLLSHYYSTTTGTDITTDITADITATSPHK